MWAVLAIAFVTSGCDRLIGLEHLGDAQVDTSPHVCAGRDPAPIFCGDFDESTQPKFYVDGVGTTSGFPQDGTVTVGPPGTMGNAITFASTGAGTAARYLGGTKMFSLDATFAMKITSTNPSNASTGLFLLSLTGSSADCYAGLDVEENAGMIELSGTCGPNAPNVFIAPIPADFVQVELTFNVATGMATISVDGVMHAITYGVQMPDNRPELEFGIHAANHPGLTVVYDDITVTGSDVM